MSKCCEKLKAFFLSPSPFIAVFFVAVTYFYFSFTYSRFATIDFSELLFYEQDNIFEPKDNIYRVVVYSSNRSDSYNILEVLSKSEDSKILAVDLLQKREHKPIKNVEFITSGINTLLQFNMRFKIKEAPIIFNIEKKHSTLYNQTSKQKIIQGYNK